MHEVKHEEVRVRAMHPSDLPDVERLQAQVYGAPELVEPIAVHASRLRLAPRCCVVAVRGDHEEGEEVVGYLVAHPWEASSWPGLGVVLAALPAGASALHIHDVAVDTRARGGRIAPRLIEAVCDVAARELGLTRATLVAVEGAHTFWERQGFRAHDAPRPPYGADAWFMSRAR